MSASAFLALAAALGMSAPDLSPAQWSSAERAQIEREERSFTPPYTGVVRGREILVAGSVSPVAVHAGVEALEKGGSAADAAAVVALTQVAMELGSTVSYAGAAQLVYYDAKTRRVYSMDAGWRSYRGETDPRSIPPPDDAAFGAAGTGGRPVTVGFGRQTMVPGFMAGIGEMHARFGRLPFATLFQPAIWYAENGIKISPRLAEYFEARRSSLWRTPEGRRFASMPNGALPKAGDVFRQPELAQTLRSVASQGAGFMYSGAWGRSYVAAVRAEGGKATLADMAAYRPVWRTPERLNFADVDVYAPGAQPGRPCPVLEELSRLDGAHLGRLGPYWRDPAAFAAYAEALNWTFRDYVDGAPSHDQCRSRLAPASAAQAEAPAAPTARAEAAQAGGPHTASVIVVDRWGDVAALTHSINSVDWGGTGIVVGGVPVSDAGAYYRLFPNAEGGERPLNVLSPVIAMRDGKPVLAVASIGLSLYPETARLVAGVLAQRQDLIALQEAPPLLQQRTPGGPEAAPVRREVPIPAGAYAPGLLLAAREGGVSIREIPRKDAAASRGTALVMQFDPLTGTPSTAEIDNLLGFAESDLQRGAEVPPEVAVPSATLDQYVGAYQTTSPAFRITFVREGDHLFAATNGVGHMQLHARTPTDFFIKGENVVHVLFQADSGKNASSALLRSNGAELTAVRVDR